MIPQPICVINPTWVAIIISIVGWFVVHGLSTRRDRILNMESQKREFLILMHQLRRDAVQAGRTQTVDEFYKSTLAQIDDAVTELCLVCTDISADLRDVWIGYSGIDHEKLKGHYEGSDGLAEKIVDSSFKKPSEMLPPYFDRFIKVIHAA